MNTLTLPRHPLAALLQQTERMDRTHATEATDDAARRILDEPVETRVVRCSWCQPRIGRVRFFAGADFSREVTSPAGLGLLSDTICPECLEQQRAELERRYEKRAA
jgi:hypothetical protein